MTLEEQAKFDTLVERVGLLESQLNALSNNATIPFNVGEALKARILSDAGLAAISTKSLTSENQAVNEGGASTYSVLGVPDGFLQITITSNIYYIPYYL